MRQTRKTPVEQRESFFDEDYRLKQLSKQLAQMNINKKVDRYLLKN
jgi:hypothetical protein